MSSRTESGFTLTEDANAEGARDGTVHTKAIVLGRSPDADAGAHIRQMFTANS